MSEVTLWVSGTPKPQGSKRAFKHKTTGNVVMVEDNKNVRDWRSDMKNVAGAEFADTPPFEGPVTVMVVFHMPRPKSHPKTKQTWPTSKPDVDKLLRAVLDALTGIAFKDDSQVTMLTGVKAWDQDHPLGRAGALIKVASDG